VQHGGGVDLGDAGLNHPEDEPNLFHGGLFVVVKGHHQALALGKIADSLGEALPEFRVQEAKKRIVLRPVGQID
jgi:hypothetical protein